MDSINPLRIVLFTNLHRAEIDEQIQQLISFFAAKDVLVLLDEYLKAYIQERFESGFSRTEVIEDDDFKADLALSVGGDGTFLNAAARIGKKNIPILGINAGRLGFLADVPTDEVIPILEDVFRKEYTIEKRTLLKVTPLDGTLLETPYALNDIAISKQDSNSMIVVHASTNGELINSYQADGLIVATPTGSTAYSLSAGGSIVAPQAENILITPVATHSLNVRPILVPDSWTIDLQVDSRSQSYLISIDGRSKILDQHTKLRIKKANYYVQLIRTKNHTFFDTLRKKLLWGADIRN